MEKCGNCKGEIFVYTPHKTVCPHCHGKGELDWIEQATGLPHPHNKDVFSFDSSKDDNGELMARIKAKYNMP